MIVKLTKADGIELKNVCEAILNSKNLEELTAMKKILVKHQKLELAARYHQRIKELGNEQV